MAKLATCPGCTTQLALPEEATLSDEARCPRCGEQFPLMEAVQFSIPTAELIPATPRCTSSEVVQWAAKPLEKMSLGSSISSEGSAISDDDESEQMGSSSLEARDTGLNASLSDWEARLKRAISVTESSKNEENTAEDVALVSQESQPSLDVPLGLSKHITEDFSFPPEDLEPEPAPEAKGVTASWSEEQSQEFTFAAEEESAPSAEDAVFPNPAKDPPVELLINTTHNAKPQSKRKWSLARTVVGACLGVVGIPLGLYALLWIKGPEADVARLARILPQSVLPAAMRSPSTGPGKESELLALNTSVPLPTATEATVPEVETDLAVHPATAELPAYTGPQFALVDRQVFDQLLLEASNAAAELSTGDFSAKAEKSRMGQAYMALCRLAEKCSFMNQPGLTDEDADQVAAAQELLIGTLSNPSVLVVLPQIAGPWWEFQARPSTGFLLVGQVEQVDTTAAGSLLRVQLGETGTVIPVLAGGAPPRPGDQIGIVGSIINDPTTSIPGLSNVSEPIVVAHFSFPLTDSSSGDFISAQ